MKTKTRIKATSLLLFNHFGEPDVGTMDIANELNMSPGNLYYHFKNKPDIVSAIFADFEKAHIQYLNTATAQLLDEQSTLLALLQILEHQVQHRFLFQHANLVFKEHPFLVKPFIKLNAKREVFLLNWIEAQKSQGIIKPEANTENVLKVVQFILQHFLANALIHNALQASNQSLSSTQKQPIQPQFLIQWGYHQLVLHLEGSLTPLGLDFYKTWIDLNELPD
jgi:AcrR family transcriptional regulator